MQGYSPTPWTFNYVEDNENGLPKVWDSNGNEVCECNGDDNTEKEANARLCVSAPKLLEACKEALVAFQLYGSGQKPVLSNAEFCDLLGEAIDKAEGNYEN